MNRVPTTVELLQQRQGLPLQTTSNSLKRNSQSFVVDATAVYSTVLSAHQSHNHEPPRKRQNSLSTSTGNRKENRDGNELRRKTDPSPPPSLPQKGLEGDKIRPIPPKPVYPVTKWSLVFL